MSARMATKARIAARAARPILHDPTLWPKQKRELERLRAGKCNDGKALSAAIAAISINRGRHEWKNSSTSADLFDEAFVATDELWWRETLPHVASLALCSSALFDGASSPLTYLPPNSRGSVHLSRVHVASLLALAFFDIIPLPESTSTSGFDEEWDMPDHLTFRNWLEDSYGTEANKALCLLHFFVASRTTFAKHDPSSEAGVAALVAAAAVASEDAVVISRLVLPEADAHPAAGARRGGRHDDAASSSDEPTFLSHGSWAPWLSCEAPLSELRVVEEGGIEEATATLQADFANEYIGGGVLHGGNVQEEIRFSICPECLVSLLICPRMRPHEAILLQGIRQYAGYQGYGYRFECSGASTGTGAAEHVICLDAVNYAYSDNDPVAQYRADSDGMLRELTKLRAALSADGGIGELEEPPKPRPFATGNWGCGVFGGDARLKALLQWLEASRNGRAVVYYPFGDPKASGLKEAADTLLAKKVTVSQLATALIESQTDMSHGRAFQAIAGYFADAS